jgi:hypothetical protein
VDHLVPEQLGGSVLAGDLPGPRIDHDSQRRPSGRADRPGHGGDLVVASGRLPQNGGEVGQGGRDLQADPAAPGRADVRRQRRPDGTDGAFSKFGPELGRLPGPSQRGHRAVDPAGHRAEPPDRPLLELIGGSIDSARQSCPPVLDHECEPDPVLGNTVLAVLAGRNHYPVGPGVRSEHPLPVGTDRVLRRLRQEVQSGQRQSAEVGVEQSRAGLEGRVAEADQPVEGATVCGLDRRRDLGQAAAHLVQPVSRQRAWREIRGRCRAADQQYSGERQNGGTREQSSSQCQPGRRAPTYGM